MHKCPKWLLDAMAEGKTVKCWLDKEHTDTGIVTGFDNIGFASRMRGMSTC